MNAFAGARFRRWASLDRISYLGPIILLCLPGFWGCGKVSEPLKVSAAADLQVVLPELIAVYTSDRPGLLRPEVYYGASGQIARQISQGAPTDIFLSADRRFVDELAGQGVLLSESVRDYTRGVLCLVAHPDVQDRVSSLESLTDEAIKKVALANPDAAPYGRAARETLQAAGLWDRLQEKLVLAENVRQAYQFVSSGNAEVGLIGSSMAGSSVLKKISLDTNTYSPIVQRLGIVRASLKLEESRAFAEFLLSPKAQQIFRRHGFLPVSHLSGTTPSGAGVSH